MTMRRNARPNVANVACTWHTCNSSSLKNLCDKYLDTLCLNQDDFYYFYIPHDSASLILTFRSPTLCPARPNRRKKLIRILLCGLPQGWKQRHGSLTNYCYHRPSDLISPYHKTKETLGLQLLTSSNPTDYCSTAWGFSPSLLSFGPIPTFYSTPT